MPRRAQWLAALAVCLLAHVAGAVSIDRVTTRLFPREHFLGLREYFTGREHTGDRTVLRTEPESRGGYYFDLQLDGAVSALPQGAVVVLDYIRALDGARLEQRFPLDDAVRRGSEILVGLTGPAWQHSPSPLLAWRASIVDAHGKELSSQESFLWEMPPRE